MGSILCAKGNFMGLLDIFLIAIGLSMDAFSVAVCKGLAMPKVNIKHMLIIALFFGGFQGLMPLIGWFAGVQFEEYITKYDHWIAFILLAIIGGNMIKESFSKDAECEEETHLRIKELFIMAIATSIDALAVGVTFAFLKVDILQAVILIGATTFILSCGGVYVGNFFGAKYKSKAEFAGGVILCLLGTKILLEHLGILVL